MKVRFFAYIRDYTGTKEIECHGCPTLKELLSDLCEKYGGKFRDKVFDGENLSGEIIILINGRHVTHYDGINSRLKEEDEISIFPVVAGG